VNNFKTLTGICVVALLSVSQAHAAAGFPDSAPAPEASSNVTFAILIALGVFCAAYAKFKKAKCSESE